MSAPALRPLLAEDEVVALLAALDRADLDEPAARARDTLRRALKAGARPNAHETLERLLMGEPVGTGGMPDTSLRARVSFGATGREETHETFGWVIERPGAGDTVQVVAAARRLEDACARARAKLEAERLRRGES